MATYNAERYIVDQINSILPQLSTHDEIIISDDYSTDKTIALINSIKDNRIRIFYNENKKGPIKNFENAIRKSVNDYIFLADQDDIWLKGKVDKCVESLGNCDLVVTDCIVVDNQLNVIHQSYFDLVNSGVGLFKNLYRNTYLGCCMAFRRDLLKVGFPFPHDIPMHDIWLGFISELFFKSCFIKEPYVLYRRHENNTSTATHKSTNSLFAKLNFRINLIKQIPVLYIRKRK